MEIRGTQHHRCHKTHPLTADIRQLRFSDIQPEVSNQDIDSEGERSHFPGRLFNVSSKFALFLITKLSCAEPSNSVPLRSL